jgi:hypothetical protein
VTRSCCQGHGGCPATGCPRDTVLDTEFKLDRLRSLIREHPADQVPVIEIKELVRILES